MTILRLVGEEHALEARADGILGRDASCEFRIEERSISRRHARLSRRGDAWWINDEGSANGIFVDGTRVREAELLAGQKLWLGAIELQVQIVDDDDGATLLVDRARLAPEPTGVPASPRRGGSGIQWLWLTLGAAAVVIAGVGLAVTLVVSFWRSRAVVSDADRTPAAKAEATPSEPADRAPPEALFSCTEPCTLRIDDRYVLDLRAEELGRLALVPGMHVVRAAAASGGGKWEGRVTVEEERQFALRVRFAAPEPPPTRPAQPPPTAPPPTTAPRRLALAPDRAPSPTLAPQPRREVAISAESAERTAPAPQGWVSEPLETLDQPEATSVLLELGPELQAAAAEVDAGAFDFAAARLDALAAALEAEGEMSRAGEVKAFAGVAWFGGGRSERARARFQEALGILGRRVRVTSPDFAPRSTELLVAAAEMLNATPMPEE